MSGFCARVYGMFCVRHTNGLGVAVSYHLSNRRPPHARHPRPDGVDEEEVDLHHLRPLHHVVDLFHIQTRGLYIRKKRRTTGRQEREDKKQGALPRPEHHGVNTVTPPPQSDAVHVLCLNSRYRVDLFSAAESISL